MRNGAILTTRGLCKSFGRFHAVRDLDLSVQEGDVYGLLGLNGAGKTTALRLITGLLRPTSGRITLFGEPVASGSPRSRRELGAFVEGPSLFGRLDAEAHLLLLGRLSGPLSRSQARELLELVGLGGALGRPASSFSLGMKQRLGLALALAPSPRLVILDEPTNGLDPRGIREMRELILRLRADKGITFLISSHLLSEVEQLCTRMGIVHEGRLVEESPTSEFLSRGTGSLVLVAEPHEEALEILRQRYGADAVVPEGDSRIRVRLPDVAAKINATLVSRGIQVHALVPERPSLEDLFIHQTGGFS